MKVKVVRKFRDKENNLKLRKTGEEFEVNQKRAIELEQLGFVEKMREPVNVEVAEI